MIKTNISIEIDSMRCGKTYELKKASEFDIPLDLETDSDAFDIVCENTNGAYTGLFCRFDSCRIKIGGEVILEGNLDSVTYYISTSRHYIKFTGRDLCWRLVDNDAIPDTIEGLYPKKYIEDKCNEYNIKHKISETEVFDKLVIGCEESEISVINNILLDTKQRIWYLIDTIYTGEWGTDVDPSYKFSMGGNGIPIMHIDYCESAVDMISEMFVYGNDGDGEQKVMSEYKNKFMIDKGIKKRSVKRYYSDSASIRYTSVAERTVRDKFRDDTELAIVVPIKDLYLPNTTAHVVIDVLGIDAIFFIKSVQYTKNINDGSIATIKMIPADSSFEKLWNSSTAISLTNFTSISEKLAK